MSPKITGPQPQTANDEPQTQLDQGQELTPDAPPRPVEETGETRPHRLRGFAAMDRTLVSDIARKGGKAAHSAGTAHEFTSDEAREAGRKGGRATHAKRRKASEAQPAAPTPHAERMPGE